MYKAYTKFDNVITKVDFNKLMGVRFIGNSFYLNKNSKKFLSILTEGKNFPSLEKWVENPDIKFEPSRETFDFYGM